MITRRRLLSSTAGLVAAGGGLVLAAPAIIGRAQAGLVLAPTSSAPPPGWVLKAHTTAFYPPSGSFVTTSAIDTTGADFIVTVVVHGLVSLAMSDSKSNTWSSIVTSAASGFNGETQIFAIQGGTVGSGHTFTITGGSGLGAIFVSAWSGSVATPTDQTNSSTAAATTIQAGLITPIQNGELIIAGVNIGDVVSTVTINSGFTQPDPFIVGNSDHYGIAMAYFVQTTAAAINPTWTFNISSTNSAAIASFKHP